MKVYLTLCNDRHEDEDLNVFTDKEEAIQYVKDWIPEEYKDMIEEEKIDGWIYYATYGYEDDFIRVEEGELDI